MDEVLPIRPGGRGGDVGAVEVVLHGHGLVHQRGHPPAGFGVAIGKAEIARSIVIAGRKVEPIAISQARADGRAVIERPLLGEHAPPVVDAVGLLVHEYQQAGRSGLAQITGFEVNEPILLPTRVLAHETIN